MFKPVNREQNRLRMAIDGPSGSGKTYTGLRFAFTLAGPTGRVAVIDTEHGSCAKYEGESPDGRPWKWDGVNLEHFSPTTYEQAIKEAGRQGYDVLFIDSLSHAWMGVGGALDQVDRNASGNKFTAWKDVTPQHTAMVEAILHSPCHVIVTLRSKMEYVLEADEKGRMVPKKVGLKPIQRDGIEYEFDLVCDLDLGHTMKVSKSRCSAVDQAVVGTPQGIWIEAVRQWLLSGSPRKESAPEAPAIVAPLPDSTSAPSGPGIVVNSHEPKIGEFHEERIKELAQELGWTPVKLADVLARKGANKLSDLTVVDAEELIQILEKKTSELQAKEAF